MGTPLVSWLNSVFLVPINLFALVQLSLYNFFAYTYIGYRVHYAAITLRLVDKTGENNGPLLRWLIVRGKRYIGPSYLENRVPYTWMRSIKIHFHFGTVSCINRALEELLRDNNTLMKFRIFSQFYKSNLDCGLVACPACKLECTRFSGINVGCKSGNRVRDEWH